MSENKNLIPYQYHTITVYKQDRAPIEDRGPRILKGCLSAFVLFLCIGILVFLAVIITQGCTDKKSDVDTGGGTTQDVPQPESKKDEIPTLPSDPSVGQLYTFTLEGTEFAFRWCPAGEFMMGSPKEESNRENEHQHKVTLSQGFWLLETEVTQEMWKKVMDKNPSEFKNDQNPVENVSWDDCQIFCYKLTEKMKEKIKENLAEQKQDPPLELPPIQLPTEAQWEYACRAGTTGPHAGDLVQMAWFNDNSGAHPHEVRNTKPNAWGLFDMHGNVFEWCKDWYDPNFYDKSPASDPENTSAAEARVYRGGCWRSNANDCSSAYRCWNPQNLAENNRGLRVLMVPKQEKTVAPPPIKVFQIEPGQGAKFEIVSYKLAPPQKRVSPRFYIYKLQDGKVIGDRQRTWWVTNGNLIARGEIPVSYKYPVWIRREGNITYKWDFQKLEGSNDFIVSNATISAEDICKESDVSSNKPFWITLSDGNKIQLKFVNRDGTAYQFKITSYKILNPKYTYDISFRVRNGGKEIYSKTKNGSRTHALNVSGMGTFEVKKQEGNFVLEVSCRSGSHGSVTYQFNINDVIDRLNQEMKDKPDQKEWTIPVIQGDNQIELKYTRP